MINGLEKAGWYIFNGCRKGDEESDWTYAGGRGEFVLDYVIGDEEIWERVERVKVEDKIESGHFPVVMWIKGGGGIRREGAGGGRDRGRQSRVGEGLGRKWRLCQDKVEKEDVGWEEMKGNIQAIFQQGQGEEKERLVGRGVQEGA